jgi:hypothetical protein
MLNFSSLSTTNLIALVTVILALSIASERLVEIIKGLWPWLNTQLEDQRAEGHRRAALQALAVVSGIATAWLSREYMPAELTKPEHLWTIIGLGLLASGGSGLWNSVLTYLTNLKDLKKAQAEDSRMTVKARKAVQP